MRIKNYQQQKKRIWMLIEFILPNLIGYFNPSLEIPISISFFIWDWLKEGETAQNQSQKQKVWIIFFITSILSLSLSFPLDVTVGESFELKQKTLPHPYTIFLYF